MNHLDKITKDKVLAELANVQKNIEIINEVSRDLWRSCEYLQEDQYAPISGIRGIAMDLGAITKKINNMISYNSGWSEFGYIEEKLRSLNRDLAWFDKKLQQTEIKTLRQNKECW